VVSVRDLVSWGLWIGWATAIEFFTYGVILRVLGREGYERYVASSLAAVIVLAFGWGLVQSLYGGATPPLPYGWVFYAVSGVLLVSSAIYLAMGKAEGVSQLLAALLVVGLRFFATSLSSGVSIGPGGTVSVTAVPSSVTIRSGEELRLTVIPSGGSPPYSVTIDWGDGSTSSGSISESGEWSHTYTAPGDKPAASYTIRVDVTDSEGCRGWNILAVIVQKSRLLSTRVALEHLLRPLQARHNHTPSARPSEARGVPALPDEGRRPSVRGVQAGAERVDGRPRAVPGLKPRLEGRWRGGLAGRRGLDQGGRRGCRHGSASTTRVQRHSTGTQHHQLPADRPGGHRLVARADLPTANARGGAGGTSCRS